MKNKVDKQPANLSQLQAYLNGKLDAKAMHRLEREAQDDPFLMDALEGYEATGASQQANLAELSARLQTRIGKKEARVIPWATLAIAAGVLGFLVVAGLLYKGQQTTPQPQLAQATQPQPPVTSILPAETGADTLANQAIITHPGQPKPLPQRIAPVIKQGRTTGRAETMAEPPVTQYDLSTNAVVNSDTVPLDEKVMGVIAQQQTDAPDTNLIVAIKKRPNSQTIVGKADGVTITERPGKRSDQTAYNLGSLAPTRPTPDLVKGSVINQADDSPVQGATIAGQASNQTSTKGKANLPADKEVIIAGAAGYQPQRAALRADSNTIPADKTTVILNEAAISRNKEVDATKAHPANGWPAYQNYLNQHTSVAANAAQGVIDLQFVVSPGGAISNITIVKGLDAAADKKAIALIANGPKWKGNTNGKPQIVTLRILRSRIK